MPFLDRRLHLWAMEISRSLFVPLGLGFYPPTQVKRLPFTVTSTVTCRERWGPPNSVVPTSRIPGTDLAGISYQALLNGLTSNIAIATVSVESNWLLCNQRGELREVWLRFRSLHGRKTLNGYEATYLTEVTKGYASKLAQCFQKGADLLSLAYCLGNTGRSYDSDWPHTCDSTSYKRSH